MAELNAQAYTTNSRTLMASTAITAGDTTTAIRMPAGRAMVAVLDVTAAATAAGDKLDVYIQTKIYSDWDDVIRFTQVLGNGGAKTYVHKIAGHRATAEWETGTGLGAAANRDVFGDEWRVRYVVTDTGAAGWTFSVVAIPF